MELIAGDIGGTHSRLAWVAGEVEGMQHLRFEQAYASVAFATADDLIRQFITDAKQPVSPDCLLLALPGPLHAQHASLTNLDWTLDAADMGVTLGMASVRFINDFQAAAAGVATLTASDVVVLNSHPAEAGAVRAITGAGTGLGLAFMLDNDSGRYQNFASEGGHIDFAPANAMQSRLLERLRAEHGHVSWERVASGLAMNDLYRFCCVENSRPLPDETIAGAALSARAEAGDAAAEAALALFIDLYGAWVGNVALLYQPCGGLYVAGGVSLNLRERMQSPRFMAAATDKGRMRSVVERTPIFLIINSRVGLQGAIATAFAPP